MTTQAQHILTEARRLADEERAEVAAALIASLDGEPDADVEQAWSWEVTRRAQEAVEGQTPGRDWSEVYDRMKHGFGNS